MMHDMHPHRYSVTITRAAPAMDSEISMGHRRATILSRITNGANIPRGLRWQLFLAIVSTISTHTVTQPENRLPFVHVIRCYLFETFPRNVCQRLIVAIFAPSITTLAPQISCVLYDQSADAFMRLRVI